MSAAGYVAIWEFTVRPDAVPEFIAAYGPAGDWARLFRQAPGYQKTLLYQDPALPGHFVTIDAWHSRGAYESFRQRFAAAYTALDRKCDTLTTAEREVGTFSPVVPGTV